MSVFTHGVWGYVEPATNLFHPINSPFEVPDDVQVEVGIFESDDITFARNSVLKGLLPQSQRDEKLEVFMRRKNKSGLLVAGGKV